MNLHQLLEQIGQSPLNEWEMVNVWVPETYPGHAQRRVWTIDVSIAVERGREHLGEFSEPWLEHIARPDPAASSEWVQVLVHGQPVFGHIGVAVDGGRALIPLPEAGPHTDSHFVWQPRTDLHGLFTIANGDDHWIDRYAPVEPLHVERRDRD